MLGAILGVILAGLLVLWASRRLRQSAGLPAGRIIYVDARRLASVEQTLYDADWGLAGRPDFILRQRQQIIPVEVKSAPAPAVPHDAHRVQLAAYCHLIETTTGRRPTYGILRYADRSMAVDYSRSLEEELRKVVELVHASRGVPQTRSHDQVERCRACGFRSRCDESLA